MLRVFFKARTFATISASKDAEFYKILGVDINSTHKDVKDAFYRLSKLYHPDVTSDEEAQSKFQAVARAYEILGNPILRQQYDKGFVKLSSHIDLSDVMKEQDSIKGFRVQADQGTSYSSFYVRNYNKKISDIWRQRANPEDLRSVFEVKYEKMFFVFSAASLFFASILLRYIYVHYNTDYKAVIWDRDDVKMK